LTAVYGQEERQRYAWAPVAALETLRLRARLLAIVRDFFAARGVWEVDTPVLSAAGVTDHQLTGFMTRFSGPGPCHSRRLYLQTSPEYPMKRLLAAGSGCIYQIAKVFRNGEVGRLHNPEFTLLEWYRLGFDHHRLMDEVAELVTVLLPESQIAAVPEKLSYATVFQHYLALDPHRASVAELANRVRAQGLQAPPGMPTDDPTPWLDLLLSHCIAPRLGQGRLTFIYDYPVSQAALARVRLGSPPVAERFELYINGIELANGFHELSNAAEQRRRFQQDQQARLAQGLPEVPRDERFLDALAAGLPDCAGVALGFERLLMIAASKATLQEVMAFPLERA
jgi:lysyl-tRNA synthetase class 2